jgi:hypothetical protein
MKLIYLELLIYHFIWPVENAELPNVAQTSKTLETPVLENKEANFLSSTVTPNYTE